MEDECGIYNCSTMIFIGYGWGVLFPVNSSEKILLNREIVKDEDLGDSLWIKFCKKTI